MNDREAEEKFPAFTMSKIATKFFGGGNEQCQRRSWEMVTCSEEL